MRLAAFVVWTALAICPAAAQQWVEHVVAERGIVIELPAEFKRLVSGLSYYDSARDRGVILWDGDVPASFEGLADEEIAAAAKVSTVLEHDVTPGWATYSVILKDSRRADARMILLCDGKSYAGFRAVYPAGDAEHMKPIVEKMAASFRATGC